MADDCRLFIAVIAALLHAGSRSGNPIISHLCLKIVRIVHVSVMCFRTFRGKKTTNTPNKKRFRDKLHTSRKQLRRTYSIHCIRAFKYVRMNDEGGIRNVMLTIARTATAMLGFKKQMTKRTIWVRPILTRRPSFGEYHNLHRDMRLADRSDFFFALRMTPERFDNLAKLVTPYIRKRNTNVRCAIGPGEQLAVTLRYLAHGDSQRMLAVSFRLGKSTVCAILRRTLLAIWKALRPKYLKPPLMQDWKHMAREFHAVWNFPNCVGAIDGKHVVIQAPANAGSEYYNYKGTHSIVLMAVCTADYLFSVVDIGASGHQSDGGIFARSAFGNKFVNSTLELPDPCVLPGSDVTLPHVIVGDAAFPLMINLMRPYPGKQLATGQAVFNYRLSRARRVVENAFGILAARWRIYHRTIFADVRTVELIVMATVCLHNFLKTEDKTEMHSLGAYCPPGYADYEDGNGNLHLGLWRDDVTNQDAVRDITSLGQNQCTYSSKAVRTEFTKYFMSAAGSVPWQTDIVNRGCEPE